MGKTVFHLSVTRAYGLNEVEASIIFNYSTVLWKTASEETAHEPVDVKFL